MGVSALVVEELTPFALDSLGPDEVVRGVVLVTGHIGIKRVGSYASGNIVAEACSL